MITSLAGTRPGHALFTSVGRAVVIDLVTLTASGVFPEYEVIPDQWDETPNPAHVPTGAFAAADDAFADVVVLNASGKRSGKRTYAVPKNVRDTAARALTASGGTAVERAVATALSSGKPVSYDTVRHVNMHFEYADLTGMTASAESDLWGGGAGEHWASKIVIKEVALRAAASAPHDLGLSGKGALNPAPPEEAIEDDDTPDEVWGSVDPSERHVFEPLSLVNPWDCAYCFGPEGALIHTQDMREQVIANYGDPSDELAAYDAHFAEFDEPSEESIRTLPMSAGGVLWNVHVPRTGPNVMLASAFFRDDQAEGCDYHAEQDDDGAVSKVYVRRPDESWGQWNPQALDWEEAGDASENGLMPLDDNGAYIVAMRQSENGGAPVAPHDIHPVEWAAADAAYDDVADEVDAFEDTDPEFFVQTDEADDTQVHALYAQRDGKWFVWDEDDADWRATPEPTNVAQVDEDEAEQVGRFLSWAQDKADPGDETITAATRIPKTGTRARRADQPGQVQRPSSRVSGSERSPYTSRTTAPGQSWFRRAGKKSSAYAPGEYGPSTAQPGTEGYTPQERSANAKKQVRDGAGRFAQGGSTVSTKAGTGTITKIDPTTQQVQVKYGDGTSAWVAAKETRVQPNAAGGPVTPKDTSPYRTSNDHGEVWLPADGPRATATTAKAYLKQLQPMLTSEQLQAMLDNTSGYFAQERARAKAINQNWNSTGRAITASANHDGVMVAFFLDPEMANQFAVEGGEAPETLHMTLAYLGDKDEAGGSADDLSRVVGEWAAKTPAISGEISGHGVFTNGDKPVTHMSVDCPELPAARQSLIEHLQANGMHPRMDHGFDPHITLAYADTPVEVPATPVTFNKVTVSHGADDMDIPLGGNMAMAAAAAKGDEPMTPDTSDVEPLHLAIVDPVDKSAVMELIDLVPASANSTAPVLFKRTAKGWEQDDNLLSALQGATPPPVVTLDKEMFPGVLKQVDTTLAEKKDAEPAPADPAATAASGEISLYSEFGELLPALTAAGGKEITPKDIAATERLKRYWTVGPGGAKIRWGQGGDFNRCVRHLTKYLGPRAKGYCQLRHHDVLGFYTSTHAKMLHGKRRGVRGGAMFDIPEEQIAIELLASWERAEAAPITADASIPGGGARFRIPIVVPEGVPTGDGRMFKPLAVTHRDLPIPLLWQLKTADGHDGSVIIGRIDTMERIANGLGNAYGVFDTNPHAVEAERLVREGFLRGVSADLDNFEAETAKADNELGKDSDAKSEKIAPDQTTISRARVMGVTAVPKPAFQECTIELLDEDPEQEAPVITDGVYSERDDEALVACALVASQIPIVPPADWFSDPGLREPTPLTVTDDGRVFGHIAAWHVDHIGLAFGTKPPRSRSGYKYFHTGVVRTDSGKDVPVGQLTLAGGHASLELTADAAVKHYDDTHSAVADVHAGEDQFGIWVAGALRPDVDAAKIRAFRASAPSGDWRPINGRLEMVAVCQVNVPGFPVARARVASGYVTALVAAGAAPLAQLKGLSVEDRVKKLENEALQAKMEAVRARMAPALSEHAESVALRASAARARMEAMIADASDLADYSPETRMDYARKGWAMPGDGAYPIANAADLKNAIRAYGRAASGDKAKVRRHIMRRARGLGRADLIPSAWTSASIEERYQDAKATFAELAQRSTVSLTASAGVQAPLEDLITERERLIARVAAVTAPAKPDEDHPALPTKGNAVVPPIVDKAPKFDPKEHPRFDTNGQFRQVMARLRSGIQGQAGTETIARQIDHVMELMDKGDLNQVQNESANLMKSIKDAAETSDHKDISDNLRAGFKSLGLELAKLPLPQGQDTVTMRWTDLPIELQTTVNDVMNKLKDHLDPEAFAKVTSEMSHYKSGVDLATSDQIQSWLSSMLQYLLDG